jgi:predicted dehydrogenase
MTDQYSITAALDVDPSRRQEAQDAFGCRTYEELGGMLRDPEVELVVVALPSHLHARASIAALEAGKLVVCEKPMATSVADADRMIATAHDCGRLLTVFQNRRYSPDFTVVRDVLQSGVLGRIVLIHMTGSGFGRRWDWQTLKEYGGGSLNNNAVHPLDQALILMGEGTPQIFCHMERALTLGDAEDHVKLILRMDGAPMIDIEVSSVSAYERESWHVMGTHGGLVGTSAQLRWRFIDPAALPARAVDRRPTPDRSYNREELAWAEHRWSLDSYDGPGEAGFYADLFKTIRCGAPLAVTPESVRRVIWVLEECHRKSPV